MAETISVPLAALLIDPKNPRLPKPNLGQRDAQRAIATDQQRKLLALAEDITAYGLNVAELPIIMQSKGDELNRYYALEGNRRLVAVRALENPEWMIGAFEPGLLTKMRALSRQYLKDPIESALCLLVKSRDEAQHWIELRHGGQQEGAGIVRWGTHEADRFRARTSPVAIHTQALDWLVEEGHLTQERRRTVPASSLKRLLETPEVASRAGIELQDGRLSLLANEKRVAKALLYIVDDLTRPGKERKRTRDIYSKPDRVKYADSIPSDVAVPPKKQSGKGTVIQPSTPAKPRAVKAKSPQLRDQLIPTDCVLNIGPQRIRDIADELRRLSLTHHTNAVSVLFRVFVELSCDAYITNKSIPADLKKDKLSKKLPLVTDHLENQNLLNFQQARAVKRATAGDMYLAASTSVMNEYVHSPYIFPQPGDLRAGWNSLQPFLTALWSV
jgi:hypothetical protein